MLTGIHFILTYTCNFECDHCFLFSSPRAGGTFTLDQVNQVLDEAEKIGTIEWIFYEGGEPFLFYPLLVEGIRRANAKGFKVGVVTNAYGTLADDDAELWLKPLVAAGLSYLSISNDQYHYGDNTENPAAIAFRAAKRLGLDTASICIEPPTVEPPTGDNGGKGNPVIGGGAKFRGRAVEKLTAGLPLSPSHGMRECPYEDLENPSRVHIDPFGHVHLCQGISMGNMWSSPLSEIVQGYRPDTHPICAPLIAGGPATLASALEIAPASGYVDACHFCYAVRKAAIETYPQYLAPRQVYGLD